MAGKAKVAVSAGDLGDELIKLFGKNDTTADAAGFLSTGYLPLNHALSGLYRDGGIPRSRITEIFGPSSSGKTSIVTDIMITAQKQGGFAGFMDYERSFDMRLAQSRGLDNSPSKFFYRKPRTFEEGIGLFSQVAVAIRKSGKLDNKAPIVWAFDSLASMTPAAIMEKLEKGEQFNMRDKLELASVTSTYFKAVATFCEELDITAIFLNQLRMKPNAMYGDPTTTPGGEAPKFYATCRIQLGATRIMKEVKESGETEKEQVGSEVKARVVKNKGYRPYKRARWTFTFKEDGTGYFDAVGSLVQLLIDRELIPKASRRGFFIWDGMERSIPWLTKTLTNDPNGLTKLEDILIANNVKAEDLEKEEIETLENELDEKSETT